MVEGSEDLVSRLRATVEAGLKVALKKALPPIAPFGFEVSLFGSRYYGLATHTSDVDMYVAGPPYVMSRVSEVLRLLGAHLEANGCAASGRNAPTLQFENKTLKWTDSITSLPVSLLLCAAEHVEEAIAATQSLAAFFEHHTACQSAMHALIKRLREASVLNSHGRVAVVGSSLKTAPFAILCAGLIAADPSLDAEAAASPDRFRNMLLVALAGFDATCLMKPAYLSKTWGSNSVYTYLVYIY